MSPPRLPTVVPILVLPSLDMKTHPSLPFVLGGAGGGSRTKLPGARSQSCSQSAAGRIV